MASAKSAATKCRRDDRERHTCRSVQAATHLGKSEVCGLAGDPLQAFGSALAMRGFVVLAPDSICFEDRRAGHTGIDPDASDWQQHYDEMTHRLVRGDTLMRKVLDDAATGLSVLLESGLIDATRLGVLGHSYGGNTVLFQAALDERIRFGCSSAAACSYASGPSGECSIAATCCRNNADSAV